MAFRVSILSAVVCLFVFADGASAQEQSTTRQPIVSNQFTTTTGSALQARRPGIYVQNGIAVQEGELTIPGDATPTPHNFYRDTFDQLVSAFLDSFQSFLETLNLGTIVGPAAAKTPQQAGLALPPDDGPVARRPLLNFLRR
jgi:hypothetical protein